MWKPLRDENRLSILKIYGYTCETLGKKSCGWLLSDLLWWISQY